MEAVDIHRVLN